MWLVIGTLGYSTSTSKHKTQVAFNWKYILMYMLFNSKSSFACPFKNTAIVDKQVERFIGLYVSWIIIITLCVHAVCMCVCMRAGCMCMCAGKTTHINTYKISSIVYKNVWVINASPSSFLLLTVIIFSCHNLPFSYTNPIMHVM